jgi:hypothetical protein
LRLEKTELGLSQNLDPHKPSHGFHNTSFSHSSMAINWGTPSGLCRLCDWLLLRICKHHGLGKLSFAKIFIAATGSPLKYEHIQNTSKYIKIAIAS